MQRKILHIDMDAFFASVEQRDDPQLRGRPVAVGGDPHGRGVVAAASYEARAYGVRSAMPSARALRLCPELIFVCSDFERYRAVSQQLHQLFAEATDTIEPLSLDEAYLDVTDDKLGLGSATYVAQHLRRRIHDVLGLTASAGVAPVKFVAKIASDYHKPDGLTVVPPHQLLDFIRPLPVEKLWGVGPATARRLHALGVRTVGELGALPVDSLDRLGSHGHVLWRLAQGDDPRPVRPRRGRKSVGAERTFAADRLDRDGLLQVIEGQAQRVCRTLCGSQLRARSVTLKVRYHDFHTVTRSGTLARPSRRVPEVMSLARALLDRTQVGRLPVRLVGLSLGQLSGPSAQLDLPIGAAPVLGSAP